MSLAFFPSFYIDFYKILGAQRSQDWDSQDSDKKSDLKDNITRLNFDYPNLGISASPKIYPSTIAHFVLFHRNCVGLAF